MYQHSDFSLVTIHPDLAGIVLQLPIIIMSLPTPNTSGGNLPNPGDFAEFEAPLIELAQRSGGDLRKLLTAFFGFLHRRTDFYCIVGSEDQHAGMGFREGDAEKLLLAAFRQFPLRKVPSQQRQQQAAAAQQQAAAAQSAAAVQNAASPSSATATNEASDSNKGNTGTSKPSAKASKPIDKKGPEPANQSSQPRLTAEGKQIPVGNGGSTDRYTWTQTLDECTVLIGIPEGVRAKDLNVELKHTALSVRSKAPILIDDNDDKNTNEPRTFVQGALTERIVPDESTWTLEGGVLVVVLYKQKKSFWETVLQGDPTIDTTLVDSQRHIGSYDEATQAQIRKIMFDQQQQSRGLPTSDELTGAKPVIPPLPAGVEYIDQEILDEKTKGHKPDSSRKS